MVRAVKPPTPLVVDDISGGPRGSGSVGAVGSSIAGSSIGGGAGFGGGALGCVRVAAWTNGHRFHLEEALVSPSGLSSGRVDPGRKDSLPSTETSKTGENKTATIRQLSLNYYFCSIS